MPLLLLIRHGENDFVKTGKLAGHLSGVHLNERGQKQAQALGEALAQVPIKAIYSSPLERALETAEPIASSHKLQIIQEPDLMDTHVGRWEGKSVKALRLTKVWKIVQQSPSRFLGMPLDHFQRLSCDTGSVSALYVGEMGANLIKLNQRPPFEFLSNHKKK